MKNRNESRKGAAEEHGCEEYRGLSRRRFLAASSATAAALAMTPRWLRGADPIDLRKRRDVLVTLFLRGGWDGLSAVAPYGDSHYSAARPTIGLTGSDVFQIDGNFGINNVSPGLYSLWQTGKLACVYDVALQYPGPVNYSRSHFERMDILEYGSDPNLPIDASAGGWVGRHLDRTSKYVTGNPLRGYAVQKAPPKSLAPPAAPTLPWEVLAFDDPDKLNVPGAASSQAARKAALITMFGGPAVGPVLSQTASTTFGSIDQFDLIDFAGYLPANGAVYPAHRLGAQLESAAALIKANVGTETIHMDFGGWDDHNSLEPQNTALLPNRFGYRIQTLGDALWNFYLDLGSTMNRVTVLVYSEFSRRVAENASLGLDHGHGGLALVLGGAVNGAVYLPTNWVPGGLNTHVNALGDLPGDTDFRNVLFEIVKKRMASTQTPAQMFSGFTNYTPLGLFP